MSLDNLVGKTLEKIEPDSATIMRLLNSADRNIQDAHVKQVSDENRFEFALSPCCFGSHTSAIPNRR